MSSEAKLLLECVLPLKALSVFSGVLHMVLFAKLLSILIVGKLNHFSAWRI